MDEQGGPVLVSITPYLPEGLSLVDRLVELAATAIEEALAPLVAPLDKPDPVPLILGMASPREGMVESREAVKAGLRRRFESRPLLSSIQIIPEGHAAGLQALERAWRIVGRGELPMCLVGGVESYMDEGILTWLAERGLLRTRANVRGFLPGEGAGFCLLSSNSPGAPRLPSLGRVASVANILVRRGSPETEESQETNALEIAWSKVLASLGDDAKITDTICDMNGESFRNEEFHSAIGKAWQYFDRGFMPLIPANCWGDVGAASGPLFVCMAVAAGSDAAMTRNLIWTSSESGARGAALIEPIGESSRGKRLG